MACEVRYCPPGGNRPNNRIDNTKNRKIFALGIAIYELNLEVSEDEVVAELVEGKLPEFTSCKPANVPSDDSVNGVRLKRGVQ
ncbi:hypothetical protein ACJ72_04756 [Emergomyces africanus]|uniref:Uncharacterized protein n=1 Tax=Emergomyces africanus TaxID=1955775 RepID=A0A1B7NVU8_9EURO|nr:hypothetical protein ACJ72_04756 [Emergomyces africanus]